MFENVIVGLLVFVYCIIVMLKQIRKPTYGWIGYPFAMVAFWALMDICVAPLVVQFTGVYWYDSDIVQRSAPMEYIPAAMVLVMWYLAVAVGMMLAHKTTRRSTARMLGYRNSLSIGTGTLWKAGIVLSLVGLLLNIVIYLLIPSGFGLKDIPQMRLFYTAQRFMDRGATSLIFGYAAMFSYVLKVGVLCLIMSMGRKTNRKLAVGLLITLWFILLGLKGGRESIILAGLALALAFHYGVRRISLITAIHLTIMIIIGLFSIYMARFGYTHLGDAVGTMLIDIFGNRYLDDVAFFFHVFRDRNDYLWGKSIGGPLLAGLIPGTGFDWTIDLYAYLNQLFGTLYHLSTGVHYASAAEMYANFGLVGVPAMGIFFGYVFGLIFSLSAVALKNRILLLYVVLALVNFFSGLPTKMPQALGGMGFQSLVPIAIIALFQPTGITRHRSLIIAFITLIFFYSLYKFSGYKILRTLASVTTAIITIISVRTVFRLSKWQGSARNRGIANGELVP